MLASYLILHDNAHSQALELFVTMSNSSSLATVDHPIVARMWDHFLGGTNNSAIDRETAKRVQDVNPKINIVALETRAFLHRCVRRLSDLGITQFIDIGSGLPTAGNTHEVAGGDARVMYVDIEPMVEVQGKALTEGKALNVGFLTWDARDIGGILNHDATRKLIDFEKPICAMLFAILHFMNNGELGAIMRTLRDDLPRGSYVVISHCSDDRIPREMRDKATELYKNANTNVYWRKREEIENIFEGFEIVEPGVVKPEDWHIEIGEVKPTTSEQTYVGVGKKV